MTLMPCGYKLHGCIDNIPRSRGSIHIIVRVCKYPQLIDLYVGIKNSILMIVQYRVVTVSFMQFVISIATLILIFSTQPNSPPPTFIFYLLLSTDNKFNSMSTSVAKK